MAALGAQAGPRPGVRAVLASLALAGWLGFAVGCGPADDGMSATPAPPFTLTALDGAEVSLESLRGRPVVIDFWATWCAPCVHQIPVLNEFQAAHPDDVVVLGISVDTAGEETVAEFAEEQEIAYRVLFGDSELARRYGAVGFPSLYVVRPDGRIGYAHVGVVSGEELEEAVAAARNP